MLGAMASGEDLAREIATRAKTVHLAARGWTPPREGPEDGDPGDFPASSYPRNCVLRPGIAELRSEGVAVVFEDGAIVEGVDAVVYATGYHYVFPFLEGETDRGKVLKDRRSPRQRGRMGTSVFGRRRRDGEEGVFRRRGG